MKLSRNQLRKLIQEVVRHQVNEAPETIDMGVLTDAVAGALVAQMIERMDSLPLSAYEMVANVDGENMPRPSRYEDVEHYAQQVVEIVMADPELKDALLTAAMDVIHNMMEPA